MHFLHPLLSLGPRVAHLPQRSVVSVAGSQASIFLNGILSSAVSTRGPFFSAFLNPQARKSTGRVLYDLFVYTRTSPQGDRQYLLEFDSRPSEGPSLLESLKKYVLRAKVKIRDESENYDVWAAWGSSAESTTPRQWNWARSGACEPVWDPLNEWPWGTRDEIIRDRRAVGMGQRLLVKKGDKPQQTLDHELVGIDDYKIHRIMHGVPEGLEDIVKGQAFPMDSNLDVMGGLDFRKGCYVGQELTVRTYHTGIVRKRILPVTIHKGLAEPTLESLHTDLLAPGLDIRARPVENRQVARPRGYGKLLTSVRGVGLALLRLEHLESVNAGDLRLELEGSEQPLYVSYWWPDWWPHPPNSVE
ncbi:Aminomethyltransferase folate-binding domain-containing protein [Mycena floridula]|nr:Aminomethyltransferase folate-binding domain-containing protein [Mycena floridula]